MGGGTIELKAKSVATSLTVTVKDSQGNTVGGASVTIERSSIFKDVTNGTTGSDGVITFIGLKEDTYKIEVSRTGGGKVLVTVPKKSLKPGSNDENISLPPSVLEAELVSINFIGGMKISIPNPATGTRFTSVADHWEAGVALNEGTDLSLRPAVYTIDSTGGSRDVKVKVRITKAEDLSAEGELTGTLGGVEIKGKCPLTVGDRDVTAKFGAMGNSLGWLHGDVTWQLKDAGRSLTATLKPQTRLEVFVTFDSFASFYAPEGVWKEVLRFLNEKVKVTGAATAAEAAERITKFCHSSHGLKYDTDGGRPAYGVSGAGGKLKLADYLISAKPVVNCFDQAAAVQSLSGALGIKAGWDYLRPFGFILKTNLVGIGNCNNPFFTSTVPPTPAIIPAKDKNREPFDNHAFCELAGKIYDACAGPHLGTETDDQYLKASIDSVHAPQFTTDPRTHKQVPKQVSGTTAQINRALPGVTGVV